MYTLTTLTFTFTFTRKGILEQVLLALQCILLSYDQAHVIGANENSA